MNDIYLAIAKFFLRRMKFKCASNRERFNGRYAAICRLHQCK